MKKIIPMLVVTSIFNVHANVVMTEYVEGSSSNKAIEISNLGTTDVLLGAEGYKLSLFSNGATTANAEQALTGKLIPGSSIIIYNNNATDEFKKPEPQGIESSSVINFNGDDVVILSNNTGIVDSFGQLGVRKQWQNDAGFNSKDTTLRRLDSIVQGDNNAEDDFTSQMTQWTHFEKNTSNGLGCAGEAACDGTQPLPEFEAPSDPGIVIFTEYVEGGGSNKVIEISNVGGSDVDLAPAGYKLQLYSNGATTANAEVNLEGLLVPQSSIVVFNSGATDAFKKAAPQGIEASSVINFNGDDAIVLVNADGVVDVFGQVGERKQWSNDNGFNSKDKTLRRLETIVKGDTVQDDDFTPNMAEWVAFDKDTADGLGCAKEIACDGSEPLPGEGTKIDDGNDPGNDEICTNCPDLEKIKNRADYKFETYYSNTLSTSNDDLAAFKAALSQDISVDYKQLTYSEVWTALTHTDEDPSNTDNVMLIYSGKSIPKAHNGSGANSSNQDYWNREHVWAKSHGFPERNQLGYTDIHHLRPADVSMNTQRSDNDFDNGGDPVTEAPENLKNGSISWEPRNAVKGDVARMMFYMDVRYETGSDASMPDLLLIDEVDSPRSGIEEPVGKLGKLCALYQWHFEDPVDAFEIERNEEIFEFQGNRNPFVDNPDWVSVLYASSCEEEVAPLTVTIDAPSSALEETDLTLTVTTSLEADEITLTQTSGVAVSFTQSANTFAVTLPSVTKDETVTFDITAKAGEQVVSESVSFVITNLAELPTPPEEKDSSGSLAWFSLILLGLLGRRFKVS